MTITRLRALLVRHHHVDSYALVLFLVAALCMLGFLALASQVRDGETFAFDHWLLLALRTDADLSISIGPDWLRAMMIDFTALGGTYVLTLVTVAVAGYLVAAGRLSTAIFLALAISGGAATNSLLKQLIARARPDVVQHLVEVTSASFPSGHAANSAICYLTIGALLARTQKSGPVRIYIVALAIAVTLLIGCSRVYLGVHWPSDVIAGWCLGGAWAVACSLVARKLQQERAIEPESGPGPLKS
jgi:undecaprenyl-diphosphatase